MNFHVDAAIAINVGEDPCHICYRCRVIAQLTCASEWTRAHEGERILTGQDRVCVDARQVDAVLALMEIRDDVYC